MHSFDSIINPSILIYLSGGYADISRLHAWNLDFVENLPAGSRYREMSSKVRHISRRLQVADVHLLSLDLKYSLTPPSPPPSPSLLDTSLISSPHSHRYRLSIQRNPCPFS